MTRMASMGGLTEAEALARAAAIGADPALEGQAIDVYEGDDGRWSVCVYFDGWPEAEAKAALAKIIGGVPLYVTLTDEDWVKKSLRELGPVRTGRFLVHGRHDRASVRPNDIGIEIEAGLAFGTGHHGTTSGCLTAIERLARRRRIGNALDLGTGSGVLAIALAKLARARVIATDIDPVATRVAAENVRLNGAADRVRTAIADGFGNRAIHAAAPFDLIVANILAGPLVKLAPAIRRHLVPRGAVILSGLLATQRRQVVAVYRGLGLVVVDTVPIGEWVTLVLAVPSRR